MELGEWPIQAEMWDGEVLAGPVPRFFSANPSEAVRAMKDNPELVWKDLNKINSKLFVAENVAAVRAFDMLSNPSRNVQIRGLSISTSRASDS